MNCSKGLAASLKIFLSKNSFQLHEKTLEKKRVQRQSILTWAVWHFATSLTTWTTTSILIFFNEKVLKCRQHLFILHFMLLPSCCKFQSFKHEIISTISLLKLQRRSSMTLPTREKVDSELMVETDTLIIF
jgi:hypothetical protein